MIPVDQTVFHVTSKANVTAIQTLPGKLATLAKKTFTTTHFVNPVTVIQQELLPNLLAVVLYLSVNYVNAKSVFKEEFVINVDLSIGI